MQTFAALKKLLQDKIDSYPAGTPDSIVNSAKVEARALELVHADLSNAAAVASDLASQVANGAGKEYTPPSVDSIIQIATIFGAYLPLAYQRMIRTGELPLPVEAQRTGGDDDLQQPS